MKTPAYTKHVRGAPPTPKYRKRHDVASEISPRKDKDTKIKRMESPVKGEATPRYVIQFHARERNGKPYIKDMMSASAVDFADIITLWILRSGAKLGFHPILLMKCMLQAGIEAWYKTTGEDFRPFLEILRKIKLDIKKVEP